MKRYRISEICDILGGGTPKTTIPEYWNGDIPWLSVKDFNNDDAYVYETEKKITQEGLKHCSATLLEKDDIVISARGTVGALTLIPFPMTFNQSCYGLRGKRELVDKHYLFYKLKNSFQSFLANSHGSVFNTITRDTFNNICIQLPDLSEQQRIAKILSTIDAKIELNKKISRELEAMAKELYDYWFVQFDFPNEQGKPYKSSGGKMVWNETLKREIPEGWEVKKLGEICVFRNGINYDKGIEGNQEYRILNVRNISSSSLLVCETELDKISLPSFQADKYLLSSNDIVIARSGTPGATRLVWRINESTIFCGFIICSTPQETAYKIYLTYCLKKLEGTSATKTGGSTLQNVSQDTLKRLFVLIPDREIVRRFNTVISPILEKNYNNMKENYTLTRLRDYLLPLLMNGQVRVSQS